MSKIGKTSAVVLSLAMLASCSSVVVTTIPETTEDQSTVATESELTYSSKEMQKEFFSDIDSQLNFISDNYESIYADYSYGEIMYVPVYFAVTDLNHNGRLEILFTCCMGSGAFSYTAVYEISEDYSSLEKLRHNPENENEPDESGDFIMFGDSDSHVAVYDCYKKDGKYYYLIEDYASAGWSDKYSGFFAYSFDGYANRDFIGGTAVSAVSDEYGEVTIRIWLYDSSHSLFEDEDSYATYMDSYWSEYEQQKSCEVKWVPIPDNDEFAAKAAESWRGFNPDSDNRSNITYDYRTNFDGFYGEDSEYEIQGA